MKYRDIKKVTPLNNYCLVKKTEETKQAETDSDGFSKTDFYLKGTPMAEVGAKDEKSDLDIKKGDFVLYRKMTENLISINEEEYIIIHDSNLIAKVEKDVH